MKIYFAGAPGRRARERIWQKHAKRRLLSFYNIIQDDFNVLFAFKLIKWKNERPED